MQHAKIIMLLISRNVNRLQRRHIMKILIINRTWPRKHMLMILKNSRKLQQRLMLRGFLKAYTNNPEKYKKHLKDNP